MAASAGRAMNIAAWIPRATYRLQFNREFRFNDATALLPYLNQLGISHCYASPYLKARPGSTHGYDIVDHSTINPEVGSWEELEQFTAALSAVGMGQILDIVPNHMGVGSDNVWWLDVLENGRASRYAAFFDIDWQPSREGLRGKVLLPVLGDTYGAALEKGELKVVFNPQLGNFVLHYFEHFFPLDPHSYAAILDREGAAKAALHAEHPAAFSELQSLRTAFNHLPAHHETSSEKITERGRDKEFFKLHLADMCARNPNVVNVIQELVRELNGTPGVAASFDALHELIKVQAFHLAYWRVAADDINYRRFFDVKELAGLRMGQTEVFAATHHFVFDLVAQRKIQGLRIDHPDGLSDPGQYFCRLQQALAQRLGSGQVKTTDKPFYLLIEKILAREEQLPERWPIHGTTGYRFANVVNGLFVHPHGELPMSRAYAAFIGENLVFDAVLYRAKKLIMKVTLASELNVLVDELGRIAQARRQTCDFTLHSLRDALVEVVACFPVYRTYITADAVSDDDRRYIETAVAEARRRTQAADLSVFYFVRDAMLTTLAQGRSEVYRQSVISFAMHMQQFTSPVMAKGMEDTSFYIYNRLASLNEVGGDPRIFGISVAEFHAVNHTRAAHWPHSMLTTSTHDTKRSEDVRARIDVLSELAGEWRTHLMRWRRLNSPISQVADGLPVPSPNDEYLLYQTLLGVWPLSPPTPGERDALCQRVQNYMLKVVREAKNVSSWINPNLAYEAGLQKFIAALFNPKLSRRFLKDFETLYQRVAWCGMLNSLAQLILKLSVPGVPDIYQGNAIWDFSLVDPDNRRPVDYAVRRALLESLVSKHQEGDIESNLNELLRSMPDGCIKLYVTWRLLNLRRQYEALFRDGEYIALQVEGHHAEHICAFARRNTNHAIIVVVQRLVSALGASQGDLPIGGRWSTTWIKTPMLVSHSSGEDVFSGRHLTAGQKTSGVTRLSAQDVFAVAPFSVIDFTLREAA